MLIEGRNPIKEALNSDSLTITKISVAKGSHDLQDLIDLARNKGIRIDFVDRQLLDRQSITKHHQGIIANAEEFKYTPIEEIITPKKDKPLFLIILDNIEDPHNLGSIIRVAECLGVDGIIIPNKRCATVNTTVLKVSTGAASHVKIAMVNNINDVIRKLKDNFVTVCGADMDGEIIYNAHLTGDIALVIGNEGSGVKQLTRKLCDKVVAIPQFGKINSLNASVACGIICSEIVRQRLN